MIGTEIGIDLGTSTTLMYIKEKGIVLNEPSVVAVDTNTDALIAVGTEAYRMLGRTHKGIDALYPLNQGVISNCFLTEKMLAEFLKQVCGNNLFKPHVIVCMPGRVTRVEQRALMDALLSAGAGKVVPIEEPIAAAIGAGVDISAPHGNMIVDVGGGTTDIAVLSLFGVSVSESIKVAGNNFDDAIVRYVRRKYNLFIGPRMAEQLKIEAGCVCPLPQSLSSVAKGRNMMSGLPGMVTVTSEDLLEALLEPAMQIVSAIQSVLEQTPPELISDIYTDGITVTGGGSLVRGLGELIKEHTGIECHIPEDPISCVAHGTGIASQYLSELQGSEYGLTPEDNRYEN